MRTAPFVVSCIMKGAFALLREGIMDGISVQKIIGLVILILGIAYGTWIIYLAIKRNAEFREERGSIPVLFVMETGIYFAASIGISDFLLNTLLIRGQTLTEDKKLPGTLVTCGLLPGAIIAFSYLKVDNPVELATLIPCVIAIILGSIIGGRFVIKLDGARITRFMRIALIGSLVALIVRIIVSRGAAGTDIGLNLPKLIIAILVSFFWGAVNMIGVPMKPAGTALFLLLGLSPIATLTMVLVMASIGPMGGGLAVIKSGNYHQRLSCSAVTGGTIGAILGTIFTISINATVLNILLIGVMVIAIISMFRKSK